MLRLFTAKLLCQEMESAGFCCLCRKAKTEARRGPPHGDRQFGIIQVALSATAALLDADCYVTSSHSSTSGVLAPSVSGRLDNPRGPSRNQLRALRSNIGTNF